MNEGVVVAAPCTPFDHDKQIGIVRRVWDYLTNHSADSFGDVCCSLYYVFAGADFAIHCIGVGFSDQSHSCWKRVGDCTENIHYQASFRVAGC